MSPMPIRIRITLVHLFVFAVNVGILGVLIYGVRRKELQEDFDERLSRRVDMIVAALELAAPQHATMEPILPTLNFTALANLHFQLRDEKGGVLESSPQLRGQTLPVPDLAGVLEGPSLETIPGALAGRLLGDAVDHRLLTQRIRLSGRGVQILQVATSLQPMLQTLESIRRLLAFVFLFGLVGGGISSWWLARLWLKPLLLIARDAQQYSAADLSRRLPVPPGKDELSQLIIVMNQMLDRLEGAFLAQDHFIANVSHELKTPLMILQAEAELLLTRPQDGALADNGSQFITSLQEEMKSLAQTVDSLLTLARAQAGMPFSGRELVSVHDAVSEAVRRCSPLAEARSVRLVVRLPESGTDAAVLGDQQLLETTVANLVRNAIEASPPGAVVDVSVAAPGASVSIAVRDRGPGIQPAARERLFHRFGQVTDGSLRKRGNGLGLAIAKAVVDLHGGTIGLVDGTSPGCEFRVELPRAPDT